MKILKSLLLLMILFVSFSCETEPSQEITNTNVQAKNSEVRFDVYIELEDHYGNSVPASTLPGYGATNLETGEIFYDSRYEAGLFESLPIGTYRFDAYDGYFDGASSAIVEVSGENETPEGWIVVTLRYWSE